MPWESRWSIDIPTQSLLSFVFNSPDGPLDHKPILVDAEKPECHLTHHTYREWSKRLALGLQQAGFQSGDRLLLYSGNTVFFPVVLMGTIAAGGIFSAANPSYVARELAYQLQDTGAKFLVVADGSLSTAVEAARSIRFPLERMFVFDDGYATFNGRGSSVGGIQHWSTLLASPAEAAAFRWDDYQTREEMDRTAVLNYSSGTTGVPKGVEITHMNYISNCRQTEYMASLSPSYADFIKRAKALSFLPMYHAYGQTHHCVSSVVRGVQVYIMRKYDFVKMLQYIEKYRITSLALVPPIAVALTKRPEVKEYDLSSVEAASCGAAPLGKESQQEFDKTFGNRFNIIQGWGMTEITCSATGWDPTRVPVAGAIGELNPNVEAMLADDDGNEVTQGGRGEFWVRGPNVMKGYWQKPAATQDTKTADGWLKTGDIACRDKDGLIYIVDRKKVGIPKTKYYPEPDVIADIRKELIKVKGNQVAPAELEALLLDHDKIQDAAVVGVTIGGEEMPRAYIVPQEHKHASPEEVGQWLAQRVARHKRLAGGVVLIDAIPRNLSGKISRKALRERAKEEIGDSAAKQSRL